MTYRIGFFFWTTSCSVTTSVEGGTVNFQVEELAQPKNASTNRILKDFTGTSKLTFDDIWTAE